MSISSVVIKNHYLLSRSSFYHFVLSLLSVELIQNATIEERVSLLEIQVVEIQEDVTGLGVDVTELDESVDFLFDEQVIPG